MQNKSELQKTLARRKQQALQHALEREQWSSGLQQQHQDNHRAELEQLKQQLAETRARHDAAYQALNTVTAERDNALRQLEALQSSPASTASRKEKTRLPADAVAARSVHGSRALSRATAAAVSILALGTLLSITAFHDAQSNVNDERQAEITALNAQDDVPAVNSDAKSANAKTLSAQKGRSKTRSARNKDTNQRQWGPALLMTDPGTAKPRVVFDPLVKDIQQNLLTLGFDIGKADGFNGMRTRQAVKEFRALYMPDSGRQTQDAALAVIIRNYAGLARADADKFGIDRGVVAAIRLSSIRTGVDFSYLMKLAATESNFEPASEAGSSSATGLYQFTRDTWLNTLKRHGTKYGLADYAAKIEYYITSGGFRRPMVRDKDIYRHLLELRKNPRISSMMAAESVRDNQQRLAYSFGRQPAQADLYLTHFLGADGAIAFLKALDENPDTFAVDIFPEAARSNSSIFHPKTCDPRTVDEVYELFGEKFNTRRYDDLAAN
ncbi:MAG TPA: hypothetical protein ENJ80_09545 [Gammaproteobacteria bacterium]|nr:hypothetical protein [Gammaproteobacteria bacterium]